MAGSPRRFAVLVAAATSVLFAVSCSDKLPVAPAGIQKAPGIVVHSLSSLFDSYNFLPFVYDDAGANDTPAQTDLNAFTRADNVSGKLGVQWTWDDIDSWTGEGQTGDACAIFDTDADGYVNYAVCVRITNDESGDVVQLPAGESPQIYGCSDKKTDRCTNPTTGPLDLMGTVCEVTTTTEGFPNLGDDGYDTLAACAISLSAIGNASNTNLLNVCSYPSGAPNSNPFDCVVTPGAGFIQIRKATTPDSSNHTFSWTLSPAATNGATSFSLKDSVYTAEQTGLIPVVPVSGGYSLTEGALPSGWILHAASCERAGASTGTKSGLAVTGIGVTVGETTVCTFDNRVGAPSLLVSKTADPTSIPETGGTVQFTVEVTNTSILAVTLTSLVDNVFGNLNGKGTCATGGSIASGASYSCAFSEALADSTAGDVHVDTVAATVQNAGGSASDSAAAVVTYTDVAPTITVTKTADPTSVPETGDSVAFAVDVKNDAAETVTLITLVDDVFGDLDGKGTCATGGTIAAGATYSCMFKDSIYGNAGTAHKDTVTATVQDDDGTSAQDKDDAVVSFTDVAPTVDVTKTASPTSVPETGDSVTFTVEVTNNAAEAVTLVSLLDDVFGNLNGKGTCATGGSIAAGATYSCAFKDSIYGNAGTTHEDTVTANVQDDDGSSASDKDDATVTFTDVAPTINVTKTADPTSVPETGDDVIFSVDVENTSAEAVTLTSLVDDVFGDLDGQGTCLAGSSIAAGGTFSCYFTQSLSGNAGTVHIDTVTAQVQDDDGSSVQDSDSATVTFTNVEPAITVTKSASPTSVPETGDSVTFTVSVKNDVTEALTLTSLVDDVFGNLNGKGTCATGGSIAAGATYQCEFRDSLYGEAGTTHRDTVTAEAQDDDATTATDKDDATVSFTDVLPDITVDKSVSPTSLIFASGGGLENFDPDTTYTENADPPDPGNFYFASRVCDDAGPNDVPAQVDLNCFDRADNMAGVLGVQWSWDDTNSWTGTGQTGDACALIDTDGDGNANVAVCARIQNGPDGVSIVQIPSSGAADVYLCNDTKPDRCAKQVTKLANILDTTCLVNTGLEAFPGQGDDGADVQAVCSIDLDMTGLSGASSLNLLNVCSFPSGEPNSNPFDCVVTPGAGFLRIAKVADPAGADLFGYVLSDSATNGFSALAVQGGVTTGLIPMLPGTSYGIKEFMPANWDLDEATCVIGTDTVAVLTTTNDSITGVDIRSGQTTLCTFENSGTVSGEVTYTIVVTNNSLEPVALDSLTDDIFGDLDGVGTCVAGGTIAGKDDYTCTFTKTLTGAPGTSHVNTASAFVKDNENNTDSDSDDATVSFVSGSP